MASILSNFARILKSLDTFTSEVAPWIRGVPSVSFLLHCFHDCSGVSPVLAYALGWYGLLAIGGGCWDEVKGIISGRVRHGAPKEMGRGE